MAVASAFLFDYEVSLARTSDNTFEGAAVSLQERAGALPGLAGPNPWVSVHGDQVALEAVSLPSKVDKVLDAVFAVVPFLWNVGTDRRLRRASVRRIEIHVPELSDSLRMGHLLRVAIELDEGAIPFDPPRALVRVSSGSNTVREWHAVATKFVPV